MGLQDKNTNLQMGDSNAASDNAWQEISGKYATAPPDDGALPQITFDDDESDMTLAAESTTDQVKVSVDQGIPTKSQFNLKPSTDETPDKMVMPEIGSPVFEDSIIDIDKGFAKEQAQLQEDLEASVDIAHNKPRLAEEIDPTRPTILIIDDSEDILDRHAQIFLKADYNVITANDGLEGLDKATRIKPELIFTGIIMPRMDGFAMIEAMRKNANVMHTPIVVTSHLGRAQDKERAKELQVRDFIVIDSISPEDIVERAHNILTVKEYALPIDLSLPEYAGLVKDLGGLDNISCPDGKTHVLRISVDSPNDLRITGRLECA